jgi:hypothetical protein
MHHANPDVSAVSKVQDITRSSGQKVKKNLGWEKTCITTKAVGTEDSVCVPPVDRCCLKRGTMQR